MKKTLMLLVIALFVFAGTMAMAEDDPLVGQWKGTHGEEVIIFVFNTDKSMSISSGGDTLGGTYAVDYKTTPINLDLMMTMGDQSQTVYTVIEFVDNDHVRIEEPSPQRPTGFDKDPIVFERAGPAAGGTAPAPTSEPAQAPSSGKSSGPSQEFEAKPWSPGTQQ